jgi:steroid delta-isomerase-like uncharacterized protein
VSAENKDLARRITEELWNGGDLDRAEELIAEDFVDHGSHAGQRGGRDGYLARLREVRDAFPDMRVVDEQLVAEGDIVVSRWEARGRHEGEWMGIAPTELEVTVRGINVWRFEAGKAAERWNSYDALGLLRQLGVDIPG